LGDEVDQREEKPAMDGDFSSQDKNRLGWRSSTPWAGEVRKEKKKKKSKHGKRVWEEQGTREKWSSDPRIS